MIARKEALLLRRIDMTYSSIVVCYIVLLFTNAALLPICHASSASPSAKVINTDSCPTVPINVDISIPPFVPPLVLINGNVQSVPINDNVDTSDTIDDDVSWSSFDKCCELADVYGCCSTKPIGKIPQMNEAQSSAILKSAQRGWNNGAGIWTQMPLHERIRRIELFLDELAKQREKIIHTLIWEIGKNYDDAAAEFDRTVGFVRQSIDFIHSSPEYNPTSFQEASSSTRVFSKRNAIGIVLCLGPYNYPLNETYATLIPALLMGNIVLLKIPTIGGLSHLLTFDAFTKALPPNTIQFISGSGRSTLAPVMKSNQIDALAFIGGTATADNLIQQHPSPHRLKLFLQLEAKNMALLLRDLFSNHDKNNKQQELSNALDEVVKGALSYNGQRCTALKIIFAPKEHGEHVAKKLARKIEKLRIGLPWEKSHDDSSIKKALYPNITPLPNQERVQYMKNLIQDAVSKGASIVNENGGYVIAEDERYEGGTILRVDSSEKKNSTAASVTSSNLMVPAILYPVTPSMNIYHEEQFGPIVPVAEYEQLEEVVKYGQQGPYGQQVSIFTSNGGGGEAAFLLDQFSAVFGKININSQCGRSPDTVPFSARKSSGIGVMSVADALQEFSIPTVIVYKEDKEGRGRRLVEEEIKKKSDFMKNL